MDDRSHPALSQAIVQNILSTVGALSEQYHITSLEEFLESCRTFAEESILNIAILGRFKAGKSSFLNHLLGQEL